MTTTAPATTHPALPEAEAATYAEWFGCLSEPTRVRLLHTVATTPTGLTIGALTQQLGISQSTCSHHVRKLADVGFLTLHKEGTSTRVTINHACCVGLPHAADAVMGLLTPRPRRPDTTPTNITIRALQPTDWPAVRHIYAQGIATGIATFDTTVPHRATLDATWLPDHRWVAEHNGNVIGWTALSPASHRQCYAGVAESAIYIADTHRGQGIGKALIRHQTLTADQAGLWTLQTTIITQNRASIALHHTAGYRTVGIRERIAHINNTWHDTLLLERRADTVACPQ